MTRTRQDKALYALILIAVLFFSALGGMVSLFSLAVGLILGGLWFSR